jgi:hypothetical protein
MCLRDRFNHLCGLARVATEMPRVNGRRISPGHGWVTEMSVPPCADGVKRTSTFCTSPHVFTDQRSFHGRPACGFSVSSVSVMVA